MHRHNSIAIPLLLAAVLGGGGCSRQSGSDGYVARVDNAVLTRDDMASTGDTAGGQTLSREYINDWVITQLLYQEAERRGLLDDPDFRRQVAATTRRLAVASLLQQELFRDLDTSAITGPAIEQTFLESPNDYLLREDVTQASYVLFAERDAANAFRTRVLRGTPWTDAVTALRAEPIASSGCLRIADRQFFTRATLYPEELWKLSRAIPRGDVSFPLKTDEGFVILSTHAVLRQGEQPPLEYARNEVRERLLIELRRKRYDDLVASLREKRSIDVHLENAQSPANP